MKYLLVLLLFTIQTLTMDPFTLAATAAAGTVQAVSQKVQNKKNRQFAEKQYEKQKADSLEFWRMQNEYNSPQAQMQRFKEAGLNPNLAYSQGNAGNAGSPDLPSKADWQGVSPGENVPGNLDMYFNLEAKAAQTDNLKAQNLLLGKEAQLKDLDKLQKALDLNIGYSTRKAIVEQAYADLNKTRGQTDLLGKQSKTELHRADSAMYKALQDQKLFDSGRWLANIQNVELRNQLMAEHLRMRKDNIEPGDQVWIKIIGGILDKFGMSLSDIIPR